MKTSKIFYGYIIVIAASLIMAIFAGTRFAFGVFFKPILTTFDWTRGMTSLAFSLSWFTQGIMGIFMGRLNDKIGPRMVITVCGFLMGIGFILMSQINALWQFYLVYAVIIGAGCSVYVPLVSTVARWFIEKRSLMTGIVVAGGGVGSFIAPPIANWLISIFDWRISYGILGIVVMVIVVSAAQFLRRDPDTQNQKHISGSDGLSLKEALFTVQLWMVVALVFCFGFCAYAITVHLVPHATDLGIAPVTAANILAVFGGLTAVGRIAIGNVGDRIGNKGAYVIGLTLLTIALFWLIFVDKTSMLYIVAVILGFAWGVSALSSPLIADLFGLHSHGVITGITTLGYCCGAAIGPWLSGYIFDITNSYQSAFIVNVAMALASVMLAVFLRPVITETQSN